jgi:hypothetical protein
VPMLALTIVDPVGDCNVFGIGWKVVVPYELGRVIPGHAGVLEIADQLLLLRGNAHDRQVAAGKAGALRGDVFELLVANRLPYVRFKRRCLRSSTSSSAFAFHSSAGRGPHIHALTHDGWRTAEQKARDLEPWTEPHFQILRNVT